MNLSRRKFILHIDDDEDDRTMLRESVKQIDSSIELWVAHNGQEGLNILVQCSLVDDLPGMIILDLNMPGMDGKKVLLDIMKHTVLSSIPVVIFTTSSSELDKTFALKHGAKLYTKPSSGSEFFQVVKNIFEASYKANR